MRIRPVHIFAGVVVLVVVVFAYAFFAPSRGAGPAPLADDDAFLERIRQKAESAGPDIEEGTVPGTTSNPEAVPRIELEVAALDVGMIPNDELFNTTIAVHNRGKTSLVIDGIDTECVCTQGEMVDSTIGPGKTGEMKIQINPYQIPGFESTKTLSIKTNDPINRLVHLPVTCTVDPEFEYEPRTVDFGEIAPGTEQKATVTLRQLGEESIKLEGAEPLGDLAALLDITTEPVPEEGWREAGKPEYRVHIRLKPTDRQGALTIPYLVKTTCERVPEYRALVRANVTGDVNAIPSNLNTGIDETPPAESEGTS